MKTAEYLAVSTDPTWVEYWTVRQTGEQAWGGNQLPVLRQWRVLASTLLNLKGESERSVYLSGLVVGHPTLLNGVPYTTGKLVCLWQRYGIIRTDGGVYYDLGIPADATCFASLYEYMAEEGRLWK